MTPQSQVLIFPLGTLDRCPKQHFCHPNEIKTSKSSGQQRVIAVFSLLGCIFLIQFWLFHLIVGSRSLWNIPWRMARLCLWQVAASCLIPAKLLSLVRLLLHAFHVHSGSVHAVHEAWQQDLGVRPSLQGGCVSAALKRPPVAEDGAI